MTTNASLAGRVALVTGAGSGIGLAVAHVIAAQGASVATTDRISDRLDGAGTWTLDLTDAPAIERVVAEIVSVLGPIDVLVNSAAVRLPLPIEADEYIKYWNETMAVNLVAQVRLVRACIPYLGRAGTGRVINIASTEGLGATPFLSSYTASKHGVVGITLWVPKTHPGTLTCGFVSVMIVTRSGQRTTRSTQIGRASADRSAPPKVARPASYEPEP